MLLHMLFMHTKWPQLLPTQTESKQEEERKRLVTGLESILNNELEVKIMKIEGTETETLTFKYCSFELLNNF